ncbi:ribosome biogenesis factor YjgA [Thermomonas fusca]|uniref:ribosome biogenesis factor YjgA n=1 Tax=Thermomonas fusca TaxID=215690 RepID=UPI0004273B4C|nr:ribosome biogenesis factor YjgA [Thermomonas fusca]
MRGRDEDTGEFLSPSRSEQRRAALDVLELGEQLTAMTATQLGRLPIPEDLMPHIRETQRITSHGARKRQHAYLAKQMRKLDDDELEAIRDAMSKDGEAARRETAALHRVEALRDALLGEDGDAALTDLLAAHPHADRQQLRQLLRNVREERAKNKPPRAFRELFRVLRELMAEAGDAASDDDATIDGDTDA